MYTGRVRVSTTLKKLIRKTKRYLRALQRPKNQKRVAIVLGIVALIAIIIPSMQHHISQAAYQPLLHIIAKGESRGNYNAYFGNVSNTEVIFTDMSIQQVLDWQDAYIAKGAASNAVGKYQFMGTTLRGLIKEQRIATNKLFDEHMQDQLAIALINRRGAEKFANKKITAEQFATNLSMEWAALPRVQGPNPEQSYYAGDGLNSAHVTSGEVLDAIESFRTLATQ